MVNGLVSQQLEGKYSDKSLGTHNNHQHHHHANQNQSQIQIHQRYSRRIKANSAPNHFWRQLTISRIGGRQSGLPVEFALVLCPRLAPLLIMSYHRTGLTVTQTWNTANALESKLELADALAKGLKTEGVFSFLPATQATGAKFNVHFKQSNFHGRAFFDLLKGPTANIDAVIGHEGFLAGAAAGYDVQKAAITTYSAAVGFTAPKYTAAVTGTDNLSVFAASYYHKVNSQVEAGAKATWNSKAGTSVGLEVASKYRLDPVSFVKVRRFAGMSQAPHVGT